MDIIDLHGIRHGDVKNLLDIFIWDNMKAGNSSVKIITGKSDRMKKIVSETLTEYGCVIEESLTNSGEIFVSLI